MIDAYDVLGIGLEATEEEIKKAYKRQSLQCHPDKVQASGASTESAGEKFHEIKLAYDILQDQDRRKIYDTFGVDLGEERPEMEVWTIGLSTLLSPMGGFAKSTVLARLAIWFIGFKWIGRLLVLCGLIVAGLYAVDFKYRDVHIRSRDVMPILMQVGLVDAVVVLFWIWPVLADGMNVFYLANEVIGVPVLVDSWKIGCIAGLVSLVVAWLLQGWWLWIIGFEVAIAVVLLIALTVAAGIMRLWIENVQSQHSERLREKRMAMRKMRQGLLDEVADLKRRLQERG